MSSELLPHRAARSAGFPRYTVVAVITASVATFLTAIALGYRGATQLTDVPSIIDIAGSVGFALVWIAPFLLLGFVAVHLLAAVTVAALRAASLIKPMVAVSSFGVVTVCAQLLAAWWLNVQPIVEFCIIGISLTLQIVVIARALVEFRR